MLCRHLGAVMLAIGLAMAGPALAEQAHMAYVMPFSPSRATDEEVENLLHSPEIEYLYVQQIITKAGVDELSRSRAEQLARAGKKIILQIWWGAAGDFPWSKYAFPNIALDEKIRRDFFREVADRTVLGYGAANLYAVSLLEEVGLQFGIDVQKRLNPDDLDDFEHFEDNNQSYDHPYYSGYGKWPGGMQIPNLRRHERDFTRITGLTFADQTVSAELKTHLFDRWVSQRIQSLAEIEFARYIHRRYPGLKAFSFDVANFTPGNARTDLGLLAGHMDGLIVDAYDKEEIANFSALRFYRVIAKDKPVLNFAWGGNGEEAMTLGLETKIARLVTTYLAGLNIAGLWTEVPGGGLKTGPLLDDSRRLAKAITKLPPFKKKSRVLLITDNTQDIYGSVWALTGLKFYDIVPVWEAYHINLRDYEVVIFFGARYSWDDPTIGWDAAAIEKRYGFPGLLDHRQLEAFVKKGGILFLLGRIPLAEDNPLFISRLGYVITDRDVEHLPEFTIKPDGWWRDTLGLNREYAFSAVRVKDFEINSAVVREGEAGYCFDYGKGSVFFVPFGRAYDRNEPYGSAAWQAYRQFLTDIIRQTLILKGKPELASEYLASPDSGNNYLEARDDRGRVQGAVQYYLQYGHLTSMTLTGEDVFTGQMNPKIDARRPATIVLTPQ
ncbi:MAG: hypothetical protein HY360_04775 [Verrucomicrobia bacterium]|nr:hypothetical protein [Verrucomicrobiota bacterium]